VDVAVSWFMATPGQAATWFCDLERCAQNAVQRGHHVWVSQGLVVISGQRDVIE
jgi:hypothetical protein